MSHEKQEEIQGDTLVDLVRETLSESPDTARAYLRESWLLAAMTALRRARRQANLTQEDVAQELETTQPAVARLENDGEGRVTLHRYIDYLLACGVMPLDITTESFEQVRRFALDEPDEPRTQPLLRAWLQSSGGRSVTDKSDAPSSTVAGHDTVNQISLTLRGLLNNGPGPAVEITFGTMNMNLAGVGLAGNQASLDRPRSAAFGLSACSQVLAGPFGTIGAEGGGVSATTSGSILAA